KLNCLFSKSKTLAICQYSEKRFTPEILRDVLATHPKIVLNGQIHQNPYYIHPDLFFAKNTKKISSELYRKIKEDIVDRKKAEKQLKELNEKLEDKVNQKISQINTLYNIYRDMAQSFDLRDSMKIIASHISEITRYDVLAEVISQKGVNQILIKAPKGDEVTTNKYISKIKKDFIKLNPSTSNNIDRIEIVELDKSKIDEIRTFLSIPLIAEDKIVGLISIGSVKEDAYKEEEISVLFNIADNISLTLQRLQVILSAKEELETVLENTFDGIILLNQEKRIVLANKMGRGILDFMGLSLGDIFDLNIEELEGQRVEKKFFNRILILTTNIVRTDYVYGWLLSLHDVTEERALQKRIMQQERLATIGKLAGGIAHDFNNILSTIIGATDIIKTNAIGSESEHLLSMITRQSVRGAELVRQILDFSRQTIVLPKKIKIEPFLKEFSKIVRATLPENIEFTVNVEDVMAKLDPVQLQQLLMNLILNSRDALSNGGKIEIIAQRVNFDEIKDFEEETIKKQKYIQLQVSDNGEGMSFEVLTKAFEPFFTTKLLGKGSGLGLSQVYGITRQANGYIDIKSEVSVGTEVSIFIPEYLGKIDEEKEEESVRGEGKILLVEDDRDVRDVIRQMLEMQGYDVIVAGNGQEALEIYDESIDLTITDVIMPQMGGNELISELKKQDSNARFIIITGYMNKSTHKNIEVLHKPISSSKLSQTVKKTITISSKI
ncbi:MAG: response regulator, partial [Candidatus Heimdallarchaeaceae archaeon]